MVYCIINNRGVIKMSLSFAIKFKKLRDILGLTQEQFAKFLRVNRSFLAQIETGIRKPSEQTLLVLEKETGVSKEWLETGKGGLFADAEKGLNYIKSKIEDKTLLSEPEICFLLETMQKSWSSCSLLTRKTHIEKLIEIMKYIINNCNVKNLLDLNLKNIFGFISEDSLEKTFDNILFLADKNSPTCSLADYTCRALVRLFRDGDFEMTEKDCEIVSSLLLPWGYYVALSYLNKEREKISSAWFDNLEFLEMSGSDFVFESFDIPENLQKDNLGLYIIVSAYNLNKAKEGWQTAGGYSIDLKDKQTYIHMTLFDLVEFVLLIKHTPAVKEDTEHKVGGFVLTITPKEKFPYAFRKICQGFIVQILFTEEQFAELKEIVEHFEKYEKFMKYAYRCYVEKYGFV